MPGQNGGANLLWTTIKGPSEGIKSVKQQMEKIGATVNVLPAEGDLSVIRAAYRDDLEIRSIGTLLNEIDNGKFGAIITKDTMMPLDTLPVSTCIRN